MDTKQTIPVLIFRDGVPVETCSTEALELENNRIILAKIGIHRNKAFFTAGSLIIKADSHFGEERVKNCLVADEVHIALRGKVSLTFLEKQARHIFSLSAQLIGTNGYKLRKKII